MTPRPGPGKWQARQDCPGVAGCPGRLELVPRLLFVVVIPTGERRWGWGTVKGGWLRRGDNPPSGAMTSASLWEASRMTLVKRLIRNKRVSWMSLCARHRGFVLLRTLLSGFCMPAGNRPTRVVLLGLTRLEGRQTRKCGHEVRPGRAVRRGESSVGKGPVGKGGL